MADDEIPPAAIVPGPALPPTLEVGDVWWTLKVRTPQSPAGRCDITDVWIGEDVDQHVKWMEVGKDGSTHLRKDTADAFRRGRVLVVAGDRS